MKQKHCLLIVFLMCAWSGFAQDQAAFGIKFSGWARTDIFYDSRQSAILREGHFMLYPENVLKDANGDDINAKGSFNILSICSRLKGTITAPDVLGAKTTGIIEGEFFGMSESDVNGFRLRHAFLKLSWPKSEVVIGQFWSPMFNHEAYPGTISFNTGSPFQPFTRNPQIRYTHNINAFRLIATAYTQRDFTSMGPDPKDPTKSISSSVFLRNSGKPDLNFQLQYRLPGTEHFIGAGIDHKSVMPELYTTGKSGKYKTTKEVPALTYFAYLRVNTKPVNIKVYSMMGEDNADLTMLGGYASNGITDSVTGARDWENIRTASVWADVQTNNQKCRFGLFMGYTKNLGAAIDLKNPVFFSRGANIDYVYRIAPRATYISGKFELSFELENTVAAYGTIKANASVEDSKEVSNLRPLVTAVLNF